MSVSNFHLHFLRIFSLFINTIQSNSIQEVIKEDWASDEEQKSNWKNNERTINSFASWLSNWDVNPFRAAFILGDIDAVPIVPQHPVGVGSWNLSVMQPRIKGMNNSSPPNICVSELGQHWFRYWLVACSASSHCLNKCCLIVNWTLRNKPQWNKNQNTKVFIPVNAFENVVCEMAAIFSRERWVKWHAKTVHMYTTKQTQNTALCIVRWCITRSPHGKTFSITGLLWGNLNITVGFPHKGSAMMMPLLFAWIINWTNSQVASDLRRRDLHVT